LKKPVRRWGPKAVVSKSNAGKISPWTTLPDGNAAGEGKKKKGKNAPR